MGLREYIIRRLLLLIPIMLGVVLLIFGVMQFVDPLQRVTIYIRNPRQFSESLMTTLIHAYGLDAPVYEQFYHWLLGMVQGNFGYSPTYRQMVLPGLLARVPSTFELVLFCAPVIIFVGIWLGVESAVRKDKPFDQVTRVISILGTSLPSFFFGIVLSAIFIAQLRWVTAGRLTPNLSTALSLMKNAGAWNQYTGLLTIDSLLNGRLDFFVDALEHLVLPVMVLVFIQTAVLVRVTRSSMLESLSKTYITAARAKGLTNHEVIYKHARRNALIPVVTISGLLVGGMMTGLIITETVFLLPGIGSWAANAAQSFDVSVVIIYALFSAAVFVFANLVVDVLYAYIDPRIRLG